MMNDTYTLTTALEIGASPEAIWNAWRDPERLAKWWGPAGFGSTVEELDLREGGAFRVTMHGPDGVDYPNTYIFDQVMPPKRLIYTNTGSEQFGLKPFQSVVDLVDDGTNTRVTLKMRFATQEEKDKHVNVFHAVEGSRELLERLSEQSRS